MRIPRERRCALQKLRSIGSPPRTRKRRRALCGGGVRDREPLREHGWRRHPVAAGRLPHVGRPASCGRPTRGRSLHGSGPGPRADARALEARAALRYAAAMSDPGATEREQKAFSDLVAVCRRLRGPEGCPWDREQTLESMTPYLVEEAVESGEAIGSGDADHTVEELGDLAFLALFCLELSGEKGGPGIAEGFERAAAKLIRRHPHVYGGDAVKDGEAAYRQWQEIKQGEKGGAGRPGLAAGRAAEGPARAGRRLPHPGEGRGGRLRLARPLGAAREGARGAGRARAGARPRHRPRARARGRRPAVRRREPGAAPHHRSRARAARRLAPFPRALPAHRARG